MPNCVLPLVAERESGHIRHNGDGVAYGNHILGQPARRLFRRESRKRRRSSDDSGGENQSQTIRGVHRCSAFSCCGDSDVEIYQISANEMRRFES
jgi:hypothetical protein